MVSLRLVDNSKPQVNPEYRIPHSHIQKVKDHVKNLE